MTDLQDERRSSAQGLERLKGLTDALYAVAFTLLAVEIGVPEITGGLTREEFAAELSVFGAQFLVYVQTFLLLGVYWVFHHYAFRYIRRSREPLVWLNLAILLFVGFMPIPTALAARQPTQDLALLLYAAFLAAIGLADLGLWWYAVSQRLVASDASPLFVRDLFVWGAAPVVTSLILIALTLVSPLAAESYFPWSILIPFVIVVIYRVVSRGRSLDAQ